MTVISCEPQCANIPIPMHRYKLRTNKVRKYASMHIRIFHDWSQIKSVKETHIFMVLQNCCCASIIFPLQIWINHNVIFNTTWTAQFLHRTGWKLKNKYWLNCVCCGPFHEHGLTSILVAKSNHIPSEVWNENTYLFPNFSGVTVDVWE